MRSVPYLPYITKQTEREKCRKHNRQNQIYSSSRSIRSSVTIAHLLVLLLLRVLLILLLLRTVRWVLRLVMVRVQRVCACILVIVLTVMLCMRHVRCRGGSWVTGVGRCDQVCRTVTRRLQRMVRLALPANLGEEAALRFAIGAAERSIRLEILLLRVPRLTPAAALPDKEPSDEDDEEQTADEDVWPAAQDHLLVCFLFLLRRYGRVLHFRRREQRPLRGRDGIVPTQSNLDEVLLGCYRIDDGCQLDIRMCLISGFTYPVTKIEKHICVAH